MCDYSLYEFPSRLARDGEELVTYRFRSNSIGLVSPLELQDYQPKPSTGFWGAVRSFSEADNRTRSVCAICVPPGARLILKDIPVQMQRDLNLGPDEGGTFIETSADLHRHRDAIQLANGRRISLQQLQEGQRIEILSLVPAIESSDDRQSALAALTI
jgi:hypothetical protein